LNAPVRFIALALLVALGACQGRHGPAARAATGMETGKVIPKVPCQADVSLTYALYLPGNYIPGNTLPVCIVFDPSGNGSFPLSRYKDLAEKYGFIMIGSNDSRNGQSMDALARVADVLYREAESRFSADSSRITLLGFSGGARVSCITALYLHKVRGVIGCGAGFPQMEKAPLFSFDYFAIAGDHDFNLAEMIALNGQLTEAHWRHQMIIWKGPHMWPPAAAVEQGILWLRGELPGAPLSADSLSAVYGIPKEHELQKSMVEHLSAGDTLWFQSQIRKLRKQMKNATSRSDSLMPARLLSLLGVMAYSNSTQQLQYNLLNQAYLTLVIYRLAEPKNPAVDSLFKVYYRKKSP
jgi:hypothetical protein